MAIPYDKEMRKSAKRDGDKYLVQVAITGKYLSDENAAKFQKTFMGHAGFMITGPMGYQQTKELWNWHRKWQKKNAAKDEKDKSG